MGIAVAAGDAGQQIMDPAGWPSGPGQAPPTGPKIAGLGRSFLRHGKLIVCVIVVLNVVALLGVHSLTPRYTASADLMVGPREEQVVDLKAVLSGLSGSSDVIESEIQVLRSREIARSVVQAMNLDQMVEFNPALQPPGLRQQASEAVTAAATSALGWLADQLAPTGIPQQIQAWLAPKAAPAPVLPPSVAATLAGSSEPVDPLSEPVDRFLAALDVASKGRSRVITVSFTSTSPVLASKVPNAVADAYIANQLDAKTNATAQATKWLDERVAEMRAQLLNADEAVEAYRRRAGIVPIRDSTLLNQQISEAGQALMLAHEQVSAAQARIASVASLNGNAAGLKRDLIAAQMREVSLQADLTTLRAQIDAGSQSEIGLRALQREADADRNLYDKLLARARETKVQSGLQQADAKMISRAERPVEPSFPKPAVILPLFFVASVVISLLMVLWLESLDRGFSSVEQLELGLGIPAITAIPLVRNTLLRRRSVESHCLEQPKSSFAESIRTLHTGLVLSGRDAPPKTVLVASSLPGEGKSWVVLACAAMMASYGKRVLVIDCDLRKPSVSRHFGPKRTVGLVECLTGQATLEQALYQDPASLVHVLPAGGSGGRAMPDLFATAAMRELLQAASTTFDLVLLDGGPVLGIADTSHLCRMADATVFVVKWNDTRCAAVKSGVRQLLNSGANVIGTILTMVDPTEFKKQSPIGQYGGAVVRYAG